MVGAVSIAQAVARLVAERPFIEEALARGIINNAALAEELRPAVERLLGRPAKFSAVNMALRRLAERLATKGETAPSFAGGDVVLQTQLLAATFPKGERARRVTRTLQARIDYARGDFLTVTQGVHEAMLITNARYRRHISRPKRIIAPLASITVRLPPESVEQVGHFFVATRALAWDNVPIVDIVSTYTEMTLLVHERDATRAYDALRAIL